MWFSEDNTGPFSMLIPMLLFHCFPHWIKWLILTELFSMRRLNLFSSLTAFSTFYVVACDMSTSIMWQLDGDGDSTQKDIDRSIIASRNSRQVRLSKRLQWTTYGNDLIVQMNPPIEFSTTSLRNSAYEDAAEIIWNETQNLTKLSLHDTRQKMLEECRWITHNNWNECVLCRSSTHRFKTSRSIIRSERSGLIIVETRLWTKTIG